MEREKIVYMAKTCEQTERFDEMVTYIKKLLENEQPLNAEERNYLSVAYKNSVGSRRTAWRIISSIESKNDKDNSSHAQILKDYRGEIEKELDEICKDIIDVLDKILIPVSEANKKEAEKKADADKGNDDSKGKALLNEANQTLVFYLKMKGDYYRYIAEYTTGDSNQEAAKEAHKAYKEAQKLANAELRPIDPIRLGLALNFSVFHYEAMRDPHEACNLAKGAFDDAIAKIDELDEEDYKDSTTIMQLIRDNLTLWTSEMDADDDENQ